MRLPKRKPGKYAGAETDRYLTPEKARRLEDDLKVLDSVERPKAIADLSAAKEMGDLSENAAYTEAKARLARIEGRMHSIRERLKNAVFIEKGPGSEGEAKLGATVIVRVNGKEKAYELVGAQETDPSRGRISYLSPLGAALMDRKAGESFTVDVNGKRLEGEILEVR